MVHPKNSRTTAAYSASEDAVTLGKCCRCDWSKHSLSKTDVVGVWTLRSIQAMCVGSVENDEEM